MRSYLAVFICLFSANQLMSQDIHFSQFNSSYLNLNPALNGSFDGTYRFNANFKNQWSSISEPYRTFSATIESRNPIASIPNLHLGLSFFNDEAGVGGLKHTQVNLNVSYNYSLDPDSTLSVSAGIQAGYSARSINFNAFSFDQQYNGSLFDRNLATGENFDQNSTSSFNFNTGVNFTYQEEKRKTFQVGASFFNLTKPDQNFQDISVPLDVRSSFYIGADHILASDLDILPSILFSSQGKFKEFLIGSNFRYRFNQEKSAGTNLYGGLWYRNQDAIIVSTGLDYLQWNFGLSYDVNISDLKTATNNRGGLELSLTYIFKNYKPTISRYKVCPSFL